MKKKTGILLVIALAFMSYGCAAKEETTATTIEIKKDGTLTHYIVEEFKGENYNETDLLEMVESEISDYNLTDGTEKIKLTEMSVEESIAKPILSFEDFSCYAAFNDVDFFYGTVAQAYEAGYDLSISLNHVEDGTTISRDDILKMGQYYIVIMEENCNVKLFKKIEYTSSNVIVKDKKEATVQTQDGELAYLLFQ